MKFNKLLWAVLGAVVLAVQTALADSTMSIEDWVTVATAAIAAFGTWIMPNTPELNTAKTWVNAMVLGSGVLVPLFQDGLTSTEVTSVIIAVLTAAGVYVIPNQSRAVRAARNSGAVTRSSGAGPAGV